MAIPVSVTMIPGSGGQPLVDLTTLVADNSLDWSSVVPGGFASCSFTLIGDPRKLLKQIPYLSIVRVIGDSGRVLFEGQVEDLAPFVNASSMGVAVGCFGLQNALKEQSIRRVWSSRQMWNAQVPTNLAPGATLFSTVTRAQNGNIQVAQGPISPSLVGSQQGIYFAGTGQSVTTLTGEAVDIPFPLGGAGITNILADFTYAGAVLLTGNVAYVDSTGTIRSDSGRTTNTQINFGFTGGTVPVTARFLFYNGGATATAPITNTGTFTNIRFLGVIAEDVLVGLSLNQTQSGFNGGTLVNSLIGMVPALGAGVIEAGTDFVIDHLDASVRRTAADILNEIAAYYSREWAVWENGLLDWKTPNLQTNQWIIPITDLTTMNLDASVENSKRALAVLYTDVAGNTGESTANSTDRRNPYVLNNRVKDFISPASLTMTANTAAQLAQALLNDLGFGPVPAAGTISLPGEKIVGHASGGGVKAWEIRAGDNITIPELPLADLFTQDGRGECLFHVVSAEANTSDGTMTFTLDSYGSKRSDVLLARLAAVTSSITG